MQHLPELQSLLNSDITRIHLLEIVDSLYVPDCRIGAGLFGAWLAAAAPYGLDDLYAGIVWPTVHFRGAKRRQFTERVRNMRRI